MSNTTPTSLTEEFANLIDDTAEEEMIYIKIKPVKNGYVMHK